MRNQQVIIEGAVLAMRTDNEFQCSEHSLGLGLSSSGVSAGMDVTFAFIDKLYGGKTAEYVANVMEYDRHLDDKWDPFADIWGTKV